MEKLHEVLSGVKCAAVSGHVNPDGDCTGSCLATYNYIKENYPGYSDRCLSGSDSEYF